MAGIDDVVEDALGCGIWLDGDSRKDIVYGISNEKFEEFLHSYGYEIRNRSDVNLSRYRIRYEAIYTLMQYLQAYREQFKVNDDIAFREFTSRMTDLMKHKTKDEEHVELQSTLIEEDGMLMPY